MSNTSRIVWLVPWRGQQVAMSVAQASAAAINEVMGDCVTMAKVLVRKKTTTLQGSIRLEPATPGSNLIRGTWGSFDVNYALWQEIGTGKMTAQPYLQPSADQHYPTLAGRIKAKLS